MPASDPVVARPASPLEPPSQSGGGDRRVPVILVATANENEGVRHLRSLALELADIVAALDTAQREAICEVVTLPDATPEQVVHTFQNESYRDRIAILHFAGHAGPEGLLLETADGSTAVADAGGLAEFLGCQRGLQLVVLNACATQAHVDSLRDAGVGAVVATSRTVEDAIAHQFAVLFYQGLGGGAGIKRAYDEAAAGVRFKHGAVARGSTADSMHASAEAASGASSRAITRKTAVTTDDGRWPWDLYFRPGAEESVAPWALPDAAGNPLFGLPKLPETDQPLAEPFRHLRPFTRAHAELFFGRGKDIRALYDQVTSATSESVVLLYGATGVGKSSLLDAGLLPRLTHTHEVRYAPRDRTLGLLGTLAKALGVEAVGAGEAAAVADGWRALETQCGRPLFVVIDQVEEAFTGEDAGRAAPGAGTRELDAFASAIGRLFANPADRPRGRLVLGFRKEWLSEVKAALETHRVARAEHRLEQLTRGGVLEAITGPTRIPARRMPVRLEVEPGLDILIADDLLAKRASHVAPLLQILLATMWAEAPRRGDVVRFDAALYEAVQAKSKQLDQFLDEQLHALREWNPAVVDSGLALDFLRFYTTPKGTSDEHTVDEEAQRYPNANEPSPGMRAMCVRLFLLVERADESSTPLPGRPARLAHDTLAPIVRERFDRSDLPGPRAKRVLDGRSAEWKDGKTGIPLDEQDLAVVEAGQHGMRAWNDDEKALVAASQAARARARRRRAWVIRGAIAAVAIIVAFGVGSWLLYRQSQDRLAESTSRELSGRSLATNAMRRDVSLLYAAAAYDQAPTFEARRALLAQLGRDPALVRVSSLFTSDMVLTADGDRVVAADVGGIKLIDLETGVVTAAPRPSAGVYDTSTFTIDPSGTAYGSVAVDTATSIATIGVWEVESGKQLGTFRVPSPDEGLAWTMGPPMADGRRLVAVGEGNETVLWDLGSATRVRRLRHAAAPERAYFSNDGSILVTTSDIGRVIVWDVATGATIKTVRIHPDRMPRVAISSDNSAMALVADDTVTMWWLRMSRAPRVLTARNYGLVAFTSGDSALVINASGGEYHVFDWPLDTLSVLVGGAPSRTLHGVGDLPGVLVASLRGNRVASSYADIIHVWDLTARRDSGNLVRVSALPLEEAAEVVFLSPDGKVAAAQGRAITIWDVEARRQVGDAIPVSTRADQPRLPVLPIVAGGSGRFIAAPGLLLGAQRTETFFDVRQPTASPKLAATDNAPPSFEPLGTRVAYGLTGSRRVVIEDLGNPGAPDTLDPGPNPGMPVDSTWGAPTAFNQRGDVLVAQVALEHVLVWDLSTRRVRDSIVVDGGMATQLYVSDDGSRVAMVFSFDKAVTFWGRGWPNPVRTLRLPTVSGWYSSALSADGRSFAVSSYEAVVLADVERGEVVGELVVPSGGSLVAFADGGRELVAVSGDGRVHRVSTDPAAWADRACRVAASPDSFRRFREDAPAGVQPPKRCASPPAR